MLGYVPTTARLLLEAGIVVELAAAGPYPTRRRAARDAGASAYVACHANAGVQVDYGLLLHAGDDRSVSLMQAVEVTLRARAPELRRIVVGQAGTGGWSAASLELIAGVGCPGLLFEPGSLDRPEHDPLWAPDGLVRVGTALAEGILAWLGR